MSDVTHILTSIERGDPHAAAELLPLVYDELRKLAAARMAAEAPGHTLDATALVHEAYLRLVGGDPPPPPPPPRGGGAGGGGGAPRRGGGGAGGLSRGAGRGPGPASASPPPAARTPPSTAAGGSGSSSAPRSPGRASPKTGCSRS